ncbi:MAG: LysR family transcriptional regulator [Sutterella sp.]|nr:LysR family transcriptional regulator [Sutterella sp.]
MLSFIHLRTFLTVIKQGSFTRAAHELSLTQPAVSGHIAALEEEFGMPLFNRTGKKIVLTDAGSILQKGARDILDRVEDLKGELTDLKALRGGTIRIGASKIIGVYMLPRILMAFRDQFPDIELQISIHSAHTIAGQVEDNAYDLAIVGEGDQIASRNIGTKVIGEDRLVVIASPNHPLASRGMVTIEELGSEPFILSGRLTASLQSLKAQLSELGVNLKSSIEMDEAGAIKRAVEEGAGLAILSRSVVERELIEGRLIELQLDHQILKRSILMLWRQDRRFSKNTEAFMRFLQKAFADTYVRN